MSERKNIKGYIRLGIYEEVKDHLDRRGFCSLSPIGGSLLGQIASFESYWMTNIHGERVWIPIELAINVSGERILLESSINEFAISNEFFWLHDLREFLDIKESSDANSINGDGRYKMMQSVIFDLKKRGHIQCVDISCGQRQYYSKIFKQK